MWPSPFPMRVGIARTSTIVSTIGRLSIRSEPTLNSAVSRGTAKGVSATDMLSISIRPKIPVLMTPFSDRLSRFPISEATVAISLGSEALSVINARVTMSLGMLRVRVTRALPLMSRPVLMVTSIVFSISRTSAPVRGTLLLLDVLRLLVGAPPTRSMPMVTHVINAVSTTTFTMWANSLKIQVVT